MHQEKLTGRESRTVLILFALGFLLFVIYGSLVPLDYKPIPLEQALRRFQAIPFLDLGIGSRADWVANVLLFIPLSFLWLGVAWPRQRRFARLPIAMLIFAAALLLSIGIEFTQLYFPPRTVSQNDILAEALGALIGILLWWRYGELLHCWLLEALNTRGQSNLAVKLLWIYLAGLFLYNVLPLDLTISPVEIYHKWRSGKVNLIPFGFFVTDPARQIYDLVTDALLWTPVSLLWVVSCQKEGMQAWSWTVLAALALELGQFFVYSRVTDVTDVLMAMVGAAFGIWVARFFSTAKMVPANQFSGVGRPFWALFSGLFWILLLVGIFWYPFDFQLDRAFLRERMSLFERVPFYSYYYGTEFRAVTELLHKTLFFLPLGAILAFGRLKMSPSVARTLYGLVAVGILIAVPIGIELGQIALPQKIPSSTDLVLEVVGGCSGYAGLLLLNKRTSSVR